MSRKVDCWDNAVAESFFGTLKQELAGQEMWSTVATAEAAVVDYIVAFYNRTRRHCTLGQLSPLLFEQQWAAGQLQLLHDLPSAKPRRSRLRRWPSGLSVILSAGETRRLSGHLNSTVRQNGARSATSAVDNETEAAIQRSLERLGIGRTVLVIAHRLSTVRNADIICVVDEGRVVEAGAHDELLTLDGANARLWRIQTGGGAP